MKGKICLCSAAEKRTYFKLKFSSNTLKEYVHHF